MKWHKDLYVGKQVRKHEKRIRRRLESGKTDVGHYLITLAENKHDQLDIINTVFLMRKERRETLPEIVGIAGSEDEAIELVEEMTQNCFAETGSANLREYFAQNNT